MGDGGWISKPPSPTPHPPTATHTARLPAASSFGKHGELFEERALAGIEQAVAPIDRGPQGLLPVGQIARPCVSSAAGGRAASAARGVSSFRRAAASSIASGRPSSRRRSPQGRRHPRRRLRSAGLCARGRQQQRDRGCSASDRRCACQIRQWAAQREHCEDSSPEMRSTDGWWPTPHSRGSGDQLGDHGRGGQKVLAVVEHQQQLFVTQVKARKRSPSDKRAAACRPHACAIASSTSGDRCSGAAPRTPRHRQSARACPRRSVAPGGSYRCRPARTA